MTKKFQSLISHEEKEENRGSVEFQVFRFTKEIDRLSSHLELHKEDYSCERGLRKILGKRQRLLAYLSKKKTEMYVKKANRIYSLDNSVSLTLFFLFYVEVR